jgi:hypothetical protein
VNRATVSRAFLAQAIFFAGSASAADVHTQPQIDLRAEQNDNFGLVPGGSPDSDVYGYVADALWLIDVATPRSGTTIRPRIKYQEFPDRSDLEKFEGFLDMHNQFRSERGTWDLFGHVSHQDLYNNETRGGDFDPVDPGAGGGSDSGDIIVGEIREEFSLRPNYEYRATERTSIGAGLEYVTTRYDADQGVPTKTDYDFAQANAHLGWRLNPTSDVRTGLYASKYEARDNSQDIDATGIFLGYEHRWSEQVGLEVVAFYEENDIKTFDPVLVKETTSNFGGEVSAYRKFEVTEWRFSIGRSYVPTGDGGKSELDLFRLQYERQLSQRLTFRGVGRYESRNGLGNTVAGIDRDFARTDLSLKWLITRNWYIGGGYAYMWEDQAGAPQTGDNNKFFINFGYEGLPYDRSKGTGTGTGTGVETP